MPDPAAKSETNDHFYCRLKITTTSGELFEYFQDRPLGRDQDHPLPAGAIEAKFRDCAKIALNPPAVETLLALCLALDTLPDVAHVLDVIASGVKTVEARPRPHPEERAKRASRRMATRSERAAMVRDAPSGRSSP
jgi:hypothetical protein